MKMFNHALPTEISRGPRIYVEAVGDMTSLWGSTFLIVAACLEDFLRRARLIVLLRAVEADTNVYSMHVRELVLACLLTITHLFLSLLRQCAGGRGL